MSYPTQYVESNALLAALNNDKDAVQDALEQMLPGDLQLLKDACGLLAATARDEVRRQRRAQ
jgi:hypothetical protein